MTRIAWDACVPGFLFVCSFILLSCHAFLKSQGFGDGVPKEAAKEAGLPGGRVWLVFTVQFSAAGDLAEYRANQLGVLLVQRLLDTVQDFVQLRAVHFDNL